MDYIGVFIMFAIAVLYVTALTIMPLPKTRRQIILLIMASAVPPILWFRAACQPTPSTLASRWGEFLANVAATVLVILILMFTQTAISAIAVNPLPVNKLLAALLVLYAPATIPWLRLGWEQIRRRAAEKRNEILRKHPATPDIRHKYQ